MILTHAASESENAAHKLKTAAHAKNPAQAHEAFRQTAFGTVKNFSIIILMTFLRNPKSATSSAMAKQAYTMVGLTRINAAFCSARVSAPRTNVTAKTTRFIRSTFP